MSAIAFMVSPVRPSVALDGEADFAVSVDGMIVYLLLSMVLVLGFLFVNIR
jgi:hypothetical protein